MKTDFLEFFGLREDPFRLTPDPAFFYPSSSHKEGLLLIDYTLDQKEGFLLLSGDPGTGKTTLLNVSLEKWKENAEVAIILTPRLSPGDFLSAVADDLGITPKSGNKNDIIRALRDFMVCTSAKGRRVVIIVDEAQNLPDETLEELRLLSNLETDKDKLLQIILIGQPELEAKLRTDRLRQLNQRIATRVRLTHFGPDETADYINYRFIRAGRENLRIERKACRLAFRKTKGIPRLINMLISRALMAAYLEERTRIEPRHIRQAAQSLGHSEMTGGLWPEPRRLAAGVLMLISILGALVAYTSFTARDRGQELPAKAEGLQMRGAADGPGAPGHVAYKTVRVTVDVALIRSEPSVDARKAGWSTKGKELLVLNESFDERQMKWYQVPFRGSARWISAEVVEEIGPGPDQKAS